MDKAYFPYGEKTKEFLLKRSFYLCLYLQHKVDKIILACNTLSLIALPFLKQFFSNVSGIFDTFIPFINKDSVIIGSKSTIKLLSTTYPNLKYLDGTELIYRIEKNINYKNELSKINEKIKNNSNIVLACSHFLSLEKNSFCIPEIKNII